MMWSRFAIAGEQFPVFYALQDACIETWKTLE